MVLARLPLRAVVALRHRPRAFGDAEHGCIEHHQRACTLTIAASSKTPVLVERSATSLVLFPFTSYSENCVEKVQRREEISSK